MTTMNLEIDSELQAWIDPLSPSELEQLEASIVRDGCRDPLVVWGSYLLDGHNRYAICKLRGIEFHTFEQAGLATKEDAKIWMIQNQMGKRNLTDFARTAMALKLKPLLESRAAGRMLSGKLDPTQNSAEGLGETREGLAKAAGVSHDTVRKVEKIIENASADVIAQVRAGEISINAAAKTIGAGKESKPARAESAPPQKFENPALHEDDADDTPDMAQLADDLQKENEAYQRQIKSLEADDKNAEIVRLNTYADQLNGRLQGEITTRNEAQGMVKMYADLLAKIRTALNVKSNREILAALVHK